jgi:hypothetical protein
MVLSHRRRYRKMNSRLAFPLALLVSLLAAGFAAAQPAGIAPGPKIEFDEYEWDFGEVYQEIENTHVFKFANVGDAPLIVNRTQTSCGCTAAIASEGPIAPGGRGEIRVTYNSKKTVGAQSKTVTVYSNAPDSVATLLVKAKVKTDVSYPSTVSFGKLPRGTAKEQAFEMIAEEGLTFEVVKVETDASHFQASFKKNGKGPKGISSYNVDVKMLATAPVGAINSRLKIYTNLPKKPVIEIPILAYVQGDLKVTPEAVNFGTFLPGKAGEVVVTVEAPESHPIRVTGVSCSTTDVMATLSTIRDGHSYEVHCSVAPTKQDGRISGKLTIETGDPNEAKREIPLIGFLKK